MAPFNTSNTNTILKMWIIGVHQKKIFLSALLLLTVCWYAKIMTVQLNDLVEYYFCAVENIVFCRPSELQLTLYQHLLNSHLVKTCLHSSSHPSSGHTLPPHLLCIAALKKLCNCPSLVHAAAVGRGLGEGEEDADLADSEVSVICEEFVNAVFCCNEKQKMHIRC